MTRNTNIQEILFPVELSDIYQYLAKPESQLTLFELEEREEEKDISKIPGYKAITNSETGKVFSVVTDGYRLVTNQEALDLAKQCFRQLFGMQDTEQMVVFNMVTPQSQSFCHIDLIHQYYTVNIWAKEIWLPYLRVTNSYNRSRALRFDLGFCRKLCDNGMIFEKETIQYKFYHTRQEISPAGQFKIDFERLKNLEASFRESVDRLNSYPVPQEAFLPLVCVALNLEFDIQADEAAKREKEKERFRAFKNGAQSLVTKYVNELGENAYAVLSVITDIVSRPFFYRTPSWMVDRLQKRAGNWFDDFAHEIRKPGFQMDQHLAGIHVWFYQEV
jgi:hypothetical protein